MILQKAIRISKYAGKKFTRPSLGDWLGISCDTVDGLNRIVYLDTVHLTRFEPLIEDLLADDWEVWEEKRELSWEEIENAFDRSRSCRDGQIDFSIYLNKVKFRLGFTK